MIITVAGNGAAGSSGNGGPPTAAELNDPTCAVPTAPGDLMIVDSGNSVVRFVSAGSGGEGEAVSVAPAQLSITAVSQTMIVGSPVPQLTATYAGFVNGDTPARLVTAPALSTSASSSSSIGSYPIVASGATHPIITSPLSTEPSRSFPFRRWLLCGASRSRKSNWASTRRPR